MLVFEGDVRNIYDISSDFSVTDDLFSMNCCYRVWKMMDFSGYGSLQLWYTDKEQIYTILQALSSH